MDDQLENVKDKIYEAALSPELWNEAARDLKVLCPESQVVLTFFDQVICQMPWSASSADSSAEKKIFSLFNGYYRDKNSLWSIMQALKPGEIGNADEFDVANKIGHTEFYQDFLLAHDFGYNVSYNMALKPNTMGACVFAYNHKINRQHTLVAYDILKKIGPDFQRAFSLSRQYAGRQLKNQNYQERVDFFSDPAFILCKDGRVDYMNAPGEVVLKTRRGVKAGYSNRLQLCDDNENQRLTQLIAANLRQVKAHDQIINQGRLNFSIRGEEGQNHLTIIPITGGEHYRDDNLLKLFTQEAERKVMVILQYNMNNINRLTPLLRKQFGLTKTECRIALGMLEGLGVKDYSDKYGRRTSTVQKHLQRIYEKTGTQNHPHLVKMLHDQKECFLYR